jgi:hypothetical protein
VLLAATYIEKQTPVSLMPHFSFVQVRVLLLTIVVSLIVPPVVPAAEDESQSLASSVQNNYSARYTEITKKILLTSIELERFSLNYRLQNCRRSTLRKLVFWGAQEAGAASGMAFEITAVQQFGQGRQKLLRLNKNSLQHGLRAAEVGSIVAASGSGFELVANVVKGAISRNKGFDFHSANRFVFSKLKDIDELIARRDALVNTHPDHPAHDRAVIEGKLLHAMRGAFVDEYAHFSSNSRSSAAVENLFYALNMSYNILGAVGAGLGYKSVNQPKLNGPSNIVFTVSGAIAAVTPLLCSAQLCIHGKLLLRSQKERWGGTESDIQEMAKQADLLSSSSSEQGSLIPSLPATTRFALYGESSKRFAKQLEGEITTMQRLRKVALQNSVLGPPIGGLLMTQGILGSRGYYKYFPARPKTQLDLSYKGAVCGTVGTTMAVAGNAAWLLASLSYEHNLRRHKKLPEQLIKERLVHLDEVEHIVSAL